MGLRDLFGLGKKTKEPFRAPREVTALRTRIAAEERENFPNFDRFRELAADAESAYRLLDGLVRQQTYAAEALNIREDLRKKMEALAAKIKKNRQEAAHAGKQDYLDRNIDYLERKSARNSAKSLFVAIIEDFTAFTRFCSEGSLEHGRDLDSVTRSLVAALEKLDRDYLRVYRKDPEVQALRGAIAQRAAELEQYVRDNRSALEVRGLIDAAERNGEKVREAVRTAA